MRGSLTEKFKSFIDRQVSSGPDWYLIGAIWLLVFFGLAILASATVVVGWQRGDVYLFLKNQITRGVLPGFFAFWFFYWFNYRRLEKWALWMLFASIILLSLVFVPGIGASWGTSNSWIRVFGFSLQPSEIVKLTFLIYLAALLSKKEKEHLKDFNYGFFPFICVLGLVAGMMFLEPDTGTMLILIVMSIAVFFVAGGSLWHLSWMGGAGVFGIWLMMKFSPYRAARLTTFLYPELDPRGIGYHINQALLAVGSGGWFGRGYGHSRQKFAYLPEVAGDSIFAIVAEELGFFISSIIIFLYLFIALRGMKLSARIEDQFGKLLVVGIIVWFTFQAFVNIGAIIGVMPLTGIPLPFISYGGTAMFSSLAAVGILANISRQAENVSLIKKKRI
jgi:cell division protein FtsW